jgi:hypothetical protein
MYKLLAWSVENAIARSERTAAPRLNDLYESLSASLELTLRLGKMLAGSDEQVLEIRDGRSLPPGLELFLAETKVMRFKPSMTG